LETTNAARLKVYLNPSERFLQSSSEVFAHFVCTRGVRKVMLRFLQRDQLFLTRDALTPANVFCAARDCDWFISEA